MLDLGVFGSKMNPESSSFARCVRHPSQFFTGFCSSCLVERLSTVDSVQGSPKPCVVQRQKQGERSLPTSDFENRSCQVQSRRTLLSLFHLDDKSSIGNQVRVESDRIGSVESRYVCRRMDAESLDHGFFRAACDVGVDDCTRNKDGFVLDGSSREKRVLFWLGCVFGKKVMRWRTRSVSKNNAAKGRNWTGEKQSEATVDLRRRSCDYKIACDLNKAPWEDPRHSWDGVMMNKVQTPSILGINGTVDLIAGKPSEVDWHNPLNTHRRRMSLPDDAILAANPLPSINVKHTARTSTAVMTEVTLASAESNPWESREHVQNGEPQKDIRIVNIRRRHHGLSKVWNRSITSPFRDLIQRRDRVLDRSLSESWRELPGHKPPETIDTGSRSYSHGSSISVTNKQHLPNRSSNVGNGDIQRYRADSQKKNRMLGRSRSVHYPSPANPDSGLLRFYLTPLRSSSRTTRKRRIKSSSSFARSIFGL